MTYRNDRDFEERPRHNFDGPYARDTHRGGLGDDYARDTGWSGAGRHDNYTRDIPSYRGRGPKNWRRSDERIHENVNERLTDHDDVDATDIEVTVENAEVTLTGIVTSRREKRIAEDVAWSCGGVNDVHNRLTIGERATHIGKASE
ncbi:MAG TPA: BON domain-containing protein [Thermoanaerobaculia bacterium]|nr:BON domain-containing protein [Thermoanaerobaculia bacterium]